MAIAINISKQGHLFAEMPISTPLGRACNIWLKNAKTAEHDKKFPDDKFQIEILVPKANKSQLRALYEACEDIKRLATAKGNIWEGVDPKTIQLPFLDGDQTAAKYPHYAGMYRLHPKRKQEKGRPAIYDAQKKLIDPGDVYAGSWGRAGVILHTYNGAPAKERVKDEATGEYKFITVETRGITMILESYQFWRDGEPITFGKANREPDASAFNDLPEGETALPPAKAFKAPAAGAAPSAAPSAAAGDDMPF